MNERALLVESLLAPKNIVLVGASPTKGSWSELVMGALGRLTYPGEIYLVNPRYEEVWGKACYPDLDSLPAVPDQLLVLVSADRAVAVIGEAVTLGSRSCVVYAGGFGEEGSEAGQRRLEQLDAFDRDGRIAICGPNCLGYVSYPAGVLSFAERRTVPTSYTGGTVAVVAQSGGVAMDINRHLIESGVRTRYAISSGNELGLCFEDYLEYFVADPEVEIIAGFVETLKEPDRFLHLSVAAAQAGKPIVMAKIGASPEAQQSTAAHTGRLAGSGKVFQDLASSCGVTVVRTIDELVDVISLFRPSRVPVTRSLGGVTISGGLKNICLDSAWNASMSFPELGTEATDAIGALLGVGTASGNPVDSGYSGLQDPNVIYRCVSEVAQDASVSAVIVQGRSIVAEYAAISDQTGKLIVMPGGGFATAKLDPAGQEILGEARGLAYCPSADRAIAGLSRLATFFETSAALRDGRHGLQPEPVAGPVAARDAQETSTGTAEVLDEDESKRLLERYGLRSPRRELLGTASELSHVVETIGYPMVLKVIDPSVPHKSELGLISPLLFDEGELLEEVARIRGRCEDLGLDAEATLWAEEAIIGGLECAVGLHRDAEFGLVVMFGTGGAQLELFGDVAFDRPTVDRVRAEELIKRTKIGQIVSGADGRTSRYDFGALTDALVAIAQIARDEGATLESLDVNPISVGARGVVVLDAIATLRPGVVTTPAA